MKSTARLILSAATTGLAGALAFPKFNLSFLIWIALVPLLFYLIREGKKRAFLAGWIAGLFFYGLLLYWIPYVPAHYGNLSLPLSLIIYFMLIALLALFWAFFSFFLAKIVHVFSPQALVLAPFLWVSFEYILTYFLTGFPWGLLGYAQAQNLPLIQISSITGVYGVSFLIVLGSSSFVQSMVQKKKRPFFIALALILLVHLGGFLSLKKPSTSSPSFKAAVIQGNVSSDIYWDLVSEEEIESLFEHHLNLTREAIRQGAEFIVWPEFTVPLCFSCSHGRYPDFRSRLEKLVQETGVSLVLGTNEQAYVGSSLEFYNTALCLTPDLSISKYYKMHLVPFGEYTPYKPIFSFIQKVTHAIGDVTPGKEVVLHRLWRYPFGSPICYEIIFPGLVRKFVRQGASFLVTITNDGWYGTSSAPYQHFQIALFRAVENRRFLLRAATTGISGFIDPYGRIIHRSRLMTSDVLTTTILPGRGQTFYARYGNLWSWVCLTLSAVFVILSLRKKSEENKKT